MSDQVEWPNDVKVLFRPWWPSKDAHDDGDLRPTAGPQVVDLETRDRHPQAAPLPPDHSFQRPCPWCGRPLEKKHALDKFVCRTCGWKG